MSFQNCFYLKKNRLIINDNLNTGTQLPFIEMAKKKGYAVIVTNTNDNYRVVDKKKKMIQVFRIDSRCFGLTPFKCVISRMTGQ